MKLTAFASFVILISLTAAQAQWTRQTFDTRASFRGISVVNEKVVWASGTGGSVIRTIDGGKTWKVMEVPGAIKLDFRDVEAFDANTAYVLSIGNGDASRIYKTVDGGATWKLQFTNTNAKAFFDAIACWDQSNCLAMSDPVEGHYVLISTSDGGANWKQIVSNDLPPARDGEAAFAASGTCLITLGKSTAFLVTGGEGAHVFRSDDRGITWSIAETPIINGTPGSGIFSIAFRNDLHGTIVGGNYEKPNEKEHTIAFTRDGGKSWYAGEGLSGYRSSVAYIDDKTVIAVGTNGTDISTDRGATWKKISDENLNAVAARGKNAVWAVGPNGVVVRLTSMTGANKAVASSTTRPPSITRLDLGHTEISSKCARTGRACSDKRVVGVRTVPVKWNGPHKYVYTVTAGKIVGDGPQVKWDLSDVQPGKYAITVGITIPYADRWGVLGSTETREVVVR